MEYEPDDYEQLSTEELSRIMREQAGRISFALSPYHDSEKTRNYVNRVVNSLQLNIYEHDDPQPGVSSLVRIKGISAISDRHVNLYLPTLDTICDDLVDEYFVNNDDVAMMHLGGGIALKLLEERISLRQDSVGKVLDTLSSIDGLHSEIKSSDRFDEDAKNTLLQAVMYSTAEDIARINCYRFAMGVLFMQSDRQIASDDLGIEQISYETRVSDELAKGLNRAVRDKTSFSKILRATGSDEDAIDRRFAEELPELGLAACFPMRFMELRALLAMTKREHLDD